MSSSKDNSESFITPWFDTRQVKPLREWVNDAHNDWCDAHPFGLLPRTFEMDSLFNELEDYLK